MSTKKLIVNDESVGSVEINDNNIITEVSIHKTVDESIASKIDIVGNVDNSSDNYHRTTI